MSDAKKTEATKNEKAGVVCPCIKCGENSVALDLDGSENFRCTSCDEEFLREDVEQYIAGCRAWAKMLKWLDSYPTDAE